MTTETDREELIKKFFELDDTDELIVRERDKLQRNFDGYVRKNKLRMLGEEEGLKAHELAIVKGVEGEGEISFLGMDTSEGEISGFMGELREDWNEV